VFITGYVTVDDILAEDVMLFTLPTISGYSLATTEKIYFSASDGNDDTVQEMYVLNSTVYVGSGSSSNDKAAFTVCYPAL